MDELGTGSNVITVDITLCGCQNGGSCISGVLQDGMKHMDTFKLLACDCPLAWTGKTFNLKVEIISAVADPGFPRGGVPGPEGCVNLLLCKKISKTLVKMKEIGSGRVPSNSIRSANDLT